MKNRIRFAITLAGAVLCALPNAAMAQGGPGDSQGGQAAAIEGTWIETISTPQGVKVLTGLQSFTAGGVVVASGTNAPGASNGSWTRVDNKTYVASFSFFAFSPAGNALAMVRVNMTLTVSDDGNSINGPATVLQCDTSGNNCGNPTPLIISGIRLIAQGASN